MASVISRKILTDPTILARVRVTFIDVFITVSTGEARRAAADVALGPVVAEGRRQPRDQPVVAGPGALHAVAAGQAGVAAALGDVLLAAGARVPWPTVARVIVSVVLTSGVVVAWL